MPSSEVAYFAVRLRVLRAAAGLSHEELGFKIWKSPQTIARWEGGHSLPSISSLQQLAAALGVQISDFLPSTADEDTLHAWNR